MKQLWTLSYFYQVKHSYQCRLLIKFIKETTCLRCHSLRLLRNLISILLGVWLSLRNLLIVLFIDNWTSLLILWNSLEWGGKLDRSNTEDNSYLMHIEYLDNTVTIRSKNISIVTQDQAYLVPYSMLSPK